ncbi:MAG: hypothetical protein KDD67_13215 [Ignavibacteriae bacterium]|nr:hypothetical protein [Ignavibacteriota bacterium]MCB9214437.1 hypothetical protein [Ignavibacteria bacterium]
MIEPQLHAESIGEWRDWLEVYHADESEIWLVFYKKKTGKQVFTYGESVEEALCFGWVDSVERGIDEERYALRFTPRKKKSTWSESNKKRVAKLIDEGKMREAGLRAVEMAKENGMWGEG